jgi:protease I
MSNKIAMVIAKEGFRKEELFVPKAIFEQAGFSVSIVSSELGIANGYPDETLINIDVLFEEVYVEEYEAIVYIGGKGAEDLFDNEQAHALAVAFIEQEKVVAAICAAPVILARAGVLDGIKATCFPFYKPDLERRKAIYTSNSVEQDGLIITASGPEVANEFGKKILDALL